MNLTGNHSDFSQPGAWRRYVPLVIRVVVILAILAIPLKIISYGYLPPDDALRHAAKAVSGKPWGDILVLGPAFLDQNFVWHFFLRQIYLLSHCGTDQLVVCAVVGLFVSFGWSPPPWLRRPETWLVTLTAVMVTSGVLPRLMLGRPFILTFAGLLTILCAWQFRGPSPPGWRTWTWVAALIGLCTLVHGVWYLWGLPVVAFFLAGQFRWGFALAAGWVAGTVGGACFTGHPVEALWYAVEIGRRTMGLHFVEHTMSMELQPFSGNIFALFIVGGLLILRSLGGIQTRPWRSNPAFWLACICWVLGFKAVRFWNDWGWPGLMVLITCDLQLLLEARFAFDSLKRLALTCGLAVVTFWAVTSNFANRWTQNLTWSYLTQDDPELKGWLPDRGGIFYTADMSLFFQTFFKNPDAPWRYMLGYEPALMPDEDFRVYRGILWNYGDAKAYAPWVEKMRPGDRLVIRGGRGNPPHIPQLEWDYGVSDIWIGRLPRVPPGGTPPDEAPPTIKATAPLSGTTNAVSSPQ